MAFNLAPPLSRMIGQSSVGWPAVGSSATEAFKPQIGASAADQAELNTSNVQGGARSAFAATAVAATVGGRRRLKRVTRGQAKTPIEPPTVDRANTKAFRRDFTKSDRYFKFGKSQMDHAMEQLRSVSGSKLLSKMRQNGFRIAIGDVTFVLAESYGFCWGVERAVAMSYEARNFFPDKNIWSTNEIIHNPLVNKNLADMGVKFIPVCANGTKNFSVVKEGDVVLLPAFGASVDEMALLNERQVQIVDTTCPWVSKVWNSVEKTKDKGHTVIIHGKYSHEETIATKSLAEKYLIVKDMAEAEYVANHILGHGSHDEFIHKFANAMSEGFDPDVDLERVGMANQTTMLKGETELIGKLLERVMIKRHGPQSISEHFVSFNTICDATQDRQDAMYKMLNAQYEPPLSELYAELEGEQVGVELLSAKDAEKLRSRKKEDATRGVSVAKTTAQRVDLCLIVGGFNSSNTTHLLEIAQEEGVPAYHIDCATRISRVGGPNANTIEHKPLETPPAIAMMDDGLEVAKDFLRDGPVVIGITSGASTPDATLGECLERVLAIRGLTAH